MCAIATAAGGQRLAGLAPADEYAPAGARAEAMLEEFVRQQRIPGFSIAVGQGGRMLWSAGFGWADVEQKVPVTPETRFRTGSVAKPLTAAAAVLLHQRGALDLDRPVREYLPEFPREAFDFTPRQLAGHLAGIRHYEDGRPLSQKRYASVAESFELFADKPLLHRPGARYRYSSYGYVLLSAVIEAAARAPFLEHMQRYVFDPLGMTSTSPEYGREVHPRRAAFYVRKAGQLQAAPFKDFSYIWAAGGFLTTPADLVRFGMGLLDDDFMDAAARDLLFTPQTTVDGKSTGYGVGWRIAADADGRRLAHHGGQTDGGRAYLLLYPEEGLVIAAMANLETASFVLGESTTIAELFLEQWRPSPDSKALRPQGVFRFSAEIDGKPREGLLHLSGDWEREIGWASEFYSKNTPVVHATVENAQTRLVLATSWGLANLWVRFDDKGFKGRWGWHEPRWPILGTRVE